MTLLREFDFECKIENGYERPLRRVADAFEKLSARASIQKDDLDVRDFTETASLISFLFSSLGVAFKFADIEYSAKVHDLQEASREFKSVSDLLQYDIAMDSVRKQGSRSRNLLRIKQGIDFVRVLFEEILSTREEYLREQASTAYAKVLAPTHNWATRKAVALGMYAIQKRSQLLKKLDEDEESLKTHCQRYISSSAQVSKHVNDMYLGRRLGIDW